jgi:hypothetical protein
MRHSAATIAIDEGVAMPGVQEMLGHSNIGNDIDGGVSGGGPVDGVDLESTDVSLVAAPLVLHNFHLRSTRDPSLVRHCQSVGYRRSPGKLALHVTRLIDWHRMSL